ncbi:hypothetical protein ROHU_025779 [Labeo rohita]|uniref:Uncharacterized protein n=1 Tax=Labeo rohita TaxID=84645 RepID=A0A498MQI3_LABRO|nr:hypothetical protein ROHU_025779 [Labeo rohita]
MKLSLKRINQESEKEDYEEDGHTDDIYQKNPIPPQQRPGRAPAARIMKLTPGPTRFHVDMNNSMSNPDDSGMEDNGGSSDTEHSLSGEEEGPPNIPPPLPPEPPPLAPFRPALPAQDDEENYFADDEEQAELQEEV